MAEIIAFPGARTPLAAQDRSAASGLAASGLAADVRSLVHDTTAVPAPASTRRRQTGAGADAPPLKVLAAQMHKESQDLARHLHDLRAAVTALSDADLPGQARALVAELGGGARMPRGADATGIR